MDTCLHQMVSIYETINQMAIGTDKKYGNVRGDWNGSVHRGSLSNNLLRRG